MGGSPHDAAKGMAHQLGGFYYLPHGVCNAILLPHVIRYNSQVAKEIKIPSGIKELDAKQEDFKILAANTLQDACGLTNPKQATLNEIIEIYKNAL